MKEPPEEFIKTGISVIDEKMEDLKRIRYLFKRTQGSRKVKHRLTAYNRGRRARIQDGTVQWGIKTKEFIEMAAATGRREILCGTNAI